MLLVFAPLPPRAICLFECFVILWCEVITKIDSFAYFLFSCPSSLSFFVSLSDNKLGPEAWMEVVKALATNQTVQTIKLDNNNLGPEAGKELAKVLTTNQAVQKIVYALPPPKKKNEYEIKIEKKKDARKVCTYC